jgi:hypothetical protein
MHKCREMELTVKELELHIKVLEEDKEQFRAENTLLLEELMNESKQTQNHFPLKPSNRQDLKLLHSKIEETMRENSEAKSVITQLRSKSKKLKNSLQKAESVNSHNILLLQTQFEKEQNEWEKQKSAYLQEIHVLKRKIMNQTHLLQKYQHNELVNNSCWS